MPPALTARLAAAPGATVGLGPVVLAEAGACWALSVVVVWAALLAGAVAVGLAVEVVA